MRQLTGPQHPPLEYSRTEEESLKSGSDSDAGSDQGGGESEASGIGSMGPTDRVNEQNFIQDGESVAFAGQASDTKWLQRLRKELDSDEDSKSKSKGKVAAPLQMPTEDTDTSTIGNQIEPFELPIKNTADRLVEAYFTSIHSSFPILNQAEFLFQYEEVYAVLDVSAYQDHTFIATLQLVFALGAVHAHLINAEWAGDDRDHILYTANARMLAVDSGIMNDLCYLGQVQVFALGALYLLASDQINR